MIVNTINRMARAMDYPSLVNPESDVNLVTDVSAPGTSYQNASYGMNGLGTVMDDITSGNFAALPGDIISGLGTGDIGSYVIVGGLAYFLLGSFFKGGSKRKSAQARRKAGLVGQIAADQSLLKSA